LEKNYQSVNEVFDALMTAIQYSDEKRDEAIKLAKSGKFYVEAGSCFTVLENTCLPVNLPLNVVKERPIFRRSPIAKNAH